MCICSEREWPHFSALTRTLWSGIGDPVGIFGECIDNHLAALGRTRAGFEEHTHFVQCELVQFRVPHIASLESHSLHREAKAIGAEIISIGMDRFVGPLASKTELAPRANVPFGASRARGGPMRPVPAAGA